MERRWELRLRPLQRTERSDAGVKGHPRVRGLGGDEGSGTQGTGSERAEPDPETGI